MKEKKLPSIDYNMCMACCVCIVECPFSCLSAGKNDIDSYKNAYPILENPSKCTGCSICAKACPIEVIEMVAAS